MVCEYVSNLDQLPVGEIAPNVFIYSSNGNLAAGIASWNAEVGFISEAIFYLRPKSMSKTHLIWFKGDLVKPQSALVPVLSLTAQFENVLGYDVDIHPQTSQVYLFRLDDHLTRLIQSCKLVALIAGMANDIKEAIHTTICVNNMDEDLSLRVTLFVDGIGSWRVMALLKCLLHLF